MHKNLTDAELMDVVGGCDCTCGCGSGGSSNSGGTIVTSGGGTGPNTGIPDDGGGTIILQGCTGCDHSDDYDDDYDRWDGEC